MKTKECKDCKQVKPIDQFHTAGKYKDKQYYRGECMICTQEYLRSDKAKESQKKYRATEKYQNTRKTYRSIPGVREKELAKDRTTEGRRKKADQKMKLYYENPLVNLKIRLRARFRQGLTAKNLEKQISVASLIGLPLPEFKEYIEKQFQPGMSWKIPGSFHIDHKIPLDSANSEVELYKLWHYTNLQPLYPKDNLTKSSKMTQS